MRPAEGAGEGAEGPAEAGQRGQEDEDEDEEEEEEEEEEGEHGDGERGPPPAERPAEAEGAGEGPEAAGERGDLLAELPAEVLDAVLRRLDRRALGRLACCSAGLRACLATEAAQERLWGRLLGRRRSAGRVGGGPRPKELCGALETLEFYLKVARLRPSRCFAHDKRTPRGIPLAERVALEPLAAALPQLLGGRAGLLSAKQAKFLKLQHRLEPLDGWLAVSNVTNENGLRVRLFRVFNAVAHSTEYDASIELVLGRNGEFKGAWARASCVRQGDHDLVDQLRDHGLLPVLAVPEEPGLGLLNCPVFQVGALPERLSLEAASLVLLAALQVVVDRNRCRWWMMERCSCMALQDGCKKLFKVREAVAMLTAGGIRCLDLAHAKKSIAQSCVFKSLDDIERACNQLGNRVCSILDGPVEAHPAFLVVPVPMPTRDRARRMQSATMGKLTRLMNRLKELLWSSAALEGVVLLCINKEDKRIVQRVLDIVCCEHAGTLWVQDDAGMIWA